MTFITDSIATYYKDNFDSLSDDKKFHFASRMGAWYDDAFSANYLASVKDTYLGSVEKITADLQNLLTNPPEAKINAAATRAPYFEKYPDLRGLMLALFRVRHLLAIYDYDARDILANIYPVENMYALSDALKSDHSALKILSTYAINVIYLIDGILYPAHDRTVPIAEFYEIGKTYKEDDPEQIQLMIYFYTHCIIGASNFYTKAVSADSLSVYQRMVVDLDRVVAREFEQVNLDNKFELLVCGRIVGSPLSITEQVYDEASRSLSNEGTFTIDTHNSHKQSNKTSLTDSEHRNVLFILSDAPYAPNESR